MTAEARIVNRLGLHARAAARFVEVAGRFRSRIEVGRDGATVDGKSILGLLTLAAHCGSTIRIDAVGPDAADALRSLTALIEDRFGEEQ